MVADLEALNKSTNDAQLASINLFNDGVNIFAKSVLLMEETRKQAASEGKFKQRQRSFQQRLNSLLNSKKLKRKKNKLTKL